MLFIVMGILIELGVYEPGRRLGSVSPWLLIILGFLGILFHIYLTFFHETMKDIAIKYDFKSKVCSILFIIAIGVFFLFSFENIFSNSAMNDIFRLIGLFGIVFCGVSNFQKYQKNKE